MNTIQELIFYKLEQKQMTAREVWAFLDNGFLDETVFGDGEWKKYFGKRVPREEALSPPKESLPAKRSGGGVKSPDRIKKPSKDRENYARMFYTLNEELEIHISKWERDLVFIDKLYRELLQKENPSLLAKTKELYEYLIKNTSNDFNSILKLLKALDGNPEKKSLNTKDYKIPVEEFKTFYEFDRYKKYLQKPKYKFLIQNYYTPDFFIKHSKVQIPLLKRENVTFLDKLIQLQILFKQVYLFWTSSANTAKEIGLNTFEIIKNKIQFIFSREGAFHSIYFTEDGDVNGIPVYKEEELCLLSVEEKKVLWFKTFNPFFLKTNWLRNDSKDYFSFIDQIVRAISGDIDDLCFCLILKSDKMIHNNKHHKKDILYLDKYLFPKSVKFLEKVEGLAITPGQAHLFYSYPELNYCISNEKLEIDGMVIPEGSLLKYENNKPQTIIFSENGKLGNHEIDALSAISIDNTSNTIIIYPYSLKTILIDQLEFENVSKYKIDEKKNIIYLKTNAEQKLKITQANSQHGTEYHACFPPNSEYYFSNNGVLEKVITGDILTIVDMKIIESTVFNFNEKDKCFEVINVYIEKFSTHFRHIILNSNFEPEKGVLDSHTHYFDFQLEKGDVVYFKLDSEKLFIAKLVIQNKRRFNNRDLYPNGEIYFFNQKTKCWYAKLKDNEMINGITLHKHSFISWDPIGKISNAILVQDTNINGVLFKEDTGVWFNINGNITKCILSQDTSINGIVFKKDTWLNFYENGNLEGGRLAQDTSINGITYKSGTTITFNEDGELL